MASKEEQREQEQLYENYLNVIQPGTKVVGIEGNMVLYQVPGIDEIRQNEMESIQRQYSETPKPIQGTDRVRVISNINTGENVFVEMLPSGRHRPLALSENPKMKALGRELDSMGYGAADTTSAEAINKYVSNYAQTEGFAYEEPQGRFATGADVPGLPPGFADDIFYQTRKGEWSQFTPQEEPEERILTVPQQIAKAIQDGQFEKARSLNELQRAFNEKRMSEEEIADRASRLAQTPQEMQAWMAAMTGSRGPMASTDTWQQRDANRRTIADQQRTYNEMGFEGDIGSPPPPESYSEAELAKFRASDPFTLSPTQLRAAGMTENGILKPEYRTKANLDQLSPEMKGIMEWVDSTAPDSEGAAPSIGTTGKTTPGSQVPLVTGPEDRSRLDRTVPTPARAQVEPTIEETVVLKQDEPGVDILRRREEILSRQNVLYKTPGKTGTVKLSRFQSTPEEREFIERTGGINPDNVTVSSRNRVEYHGSGVGASPRRDSEPRPELFYGSEEEELLQEEPRMSVMPTRSIRDIERSISRSRAAGMPVTPLSEEELQLMEEDRAASLGRQDASRMFDPRDVTLEDAQRTAQARMRMMGYGPTPTAPDRSRLMMEDPRDPTAYMSGGGATEAYRARLRREAQDQISGDRSRFELLPSETSTGMLNPEVWSRDMARRKAQKDIPGEVLAEDRSRMEPKAMRSSLGMLDPDVASLEYARQLAQAGIPADVISEDRSRMEPTALRSSLGMIDPDAASVDYARRLAQQEMAAAGLRYDPVLDEEQQMLLDEPTARGLRGMGTFPSYQMAQQYGDMRPPETDRPFRGSRSSLGMIDPSITLEQARLMAQQDFPSDWHTTGRQDTRPFTGAVSPLGMLDPSKVGLEPAQIIARESARAQFPSPPPDTAMTGTVATQPILDPIEDIGAMPRRAEDILAAPGAAELYERGLGRLAISPREMEFLDTSLVDIDERKTNKNPIGSFQYGGSVPKTGPYQLHEGEFVFNQNPYEDLGTDIFASDYERRRKNREGSWGIPSSGSAMPSSPTASMVGPDRSRFNVDTTVNPVYGDEPIQDQFAATQAVIQANQAQRDEEREARREERRKRMAEGRLTQMDKAAKAPRGVSGGGAFFAGSQIIPYASTADRLKALQRSGLSRSQAAGFDQAEREKSMARQQRFVRRGGKRSTYG